jgi:hypothetical protein
MCVPVRFVMYCSLLRDGGRLSTASAVRAQTRDVAVCPSHHHVHALVAQDNVMKAQLAVGFRLFSETYTSIVTVDPGARVLVRALLGSGVFAREASTARGAATLV